MYTKESEVFWELGRRFEFRETKFSIRNFKPTCLCWELHRGGIPELSHELQKKCMDRIKAHIDIQISLGEYGNSIYYCGDYLFKLIDERATAAYLLALEAEEEESATH